MALKNYLVIDGGIEYTVQLEEDTAKERGLTLAETVEEKPQPRKNITPANKKAAVQTK